MPTIHKSPDDRWPAASRGLTIQLLPGVHGPAEFSGAPDMAIVGADGVIIEGSLLPGGGEPPCSLRFHNGCHRLQILGPLEVRGSEGRGIRITAADDILLRDLYIHHCSIEGVITGDCRNGMYEGLTVEESEGYAPGYPPDKCHGIYISGNADGSHIQDLTVRRCTGSGLQINGAGMNAVATGLVASEMLFEHCGSGGTPPISLMAVADSTIERFNEDWTAGDRWAVCFADGQGPAYACRNIRFTDYTVPRGTECAKEEGSTLIYELPGNGWSPEETEPEPEPEPEPPPAAEEVSALIAEAEAAIAVITQQATIAQNALEAAQVLLEEVNG